MRAPCARAEVCVHVDRAETWSVVQRCVETPATQTHSGSSAHLADLLPGRREAQVLLLLVLLLLARSVPASVLILVEVESLEVSL